MTSRVLRRYARAFLLGLAQASSPKEYAREAVGFLAKEGVLTVPEHFIAAVEHEYPLVFGADTVTFTSAHRVTQEVKAALEEAFPHAEVKMVIDPRLIGGAHLAYADRVRDGSLAGSLERLKQSLTL